MKFKKSAFAKKFTEKHATVQRPVGVESSACRRHCFTFVVSTLTFIFSLALKADNSLPTGVPWSQELRDQAEAGDGDSLYLLATAYIKGLGVDVDFDTGVTWLNRAISAYEKEAESGDVHAHLKLGTLWMTGKKLDLAIPHFRSAAKAGNTKGMYLYALYSSGKDASDEENQEALEWLVKAGSRGSGEAYHYAAIMHRQGIGVPTSQKTAAELLLKGAKLKDPDCMFEVGFYYEKGIEFEQSYETALFFYNGAAELGNSDANFRAGRIVQKNKGPGDNERAFQYFLRAAELGHTEAQFEVARVYLENEDAEKAVEWATMAANAGHIHAQETLATLYEKGDGTPKDLRQAFSWHKKAMEKGSAVGKFFVAKCYMKGELNRALNHDIDEDLGIKLMVQSAAEGNPLATERLEKVYFRNSENDIKSIVKWRKENQRILDGWDLLERNRIPPSKFLKGMKEALKRDVLLASEEIDISLWFGKLSRKDKEMLVEIGWADTDFFEVLKDWEKTKATMRFIANEYKEEIEIQREINTAP